MRFYYFTNTFMLKGKGITQKCKVENGLCHPAFSELVDNASIG